MKKYLLFISGMLLFFCLTAPTVFAKNEALHAPFDQPNELDGFTQESINTPVKVNTSDSRDQSRDYYMFFGGVRRGDTSQNFLNRRSATTSAIGKNVRNVGILYPSVIGVPKTNIDVIGYSFDYNTNGGSDYDGTNGSGFDFAPLSPTTGRLAAGDMFPTSIVTANKSYSTIEELWVNAANHTIKAYGYVTSSNRTTYKVKVTGTSLNSRGRVNFRLEFESPFSTTRTFASGFGVHMDIYGQHRSSKMYSLGNSRGLYFKHDGSLGANLIADRAPYFLTFFRGKDSYRQGSYYPTEMFANNGAEAFFRQIFGTTVNVYSRNGITDIAEDWQYNYTSHPGWMFRYPQLTVPSRGIGAVDLEMAVSAVKTRSVTANYLDEDGKVLFREVQSIQENEPYNVPYQELPGYIHTKTEGALSGIVEVGQSPTVTFYHKREQFSLRQTIQNKTYASTNEVRNSDTLQVNYRVDSKIKPQFTNNFYDTFSVVIPIDKNLNNPKEIKVEAEGKVLTNSTVFDAQNRRLTVTVKREHGIHASSNIDVSFAAVVKNDAKKGEKIAFQASAGGTYSQMPEEAVKQSSEKSERTVIPRDTKLTIDFLDRKGTKLQPSVQIDQEIGARVQINQLTQVQAALKTLADRGFVVFQEAETSFIMPDDPKTVSYRLVKEVTFYVKRTWLGNPAQIVTEAKGYLLFTQGEHQSVIETVSGKTNEMAEKATYQKIKIRIEEPNTPLFVQPVISGFYQTKGYVVGKSVADMALNKKQEGYYTYPYASTEKEVWLTALTESVEEKPVFYSMSQLYQQYGIKKE